MNNNKITDNEIIKALECCIADKMICDKCPIQDECENNPFDETLGKYAFDLINRYNADVETLENNLKFVRGTLTRALDENESLKKMCKTSKTKAIKEFAERLKADLDDGYDIDIVDALIKEMIGEIDA